jgi:hypothetical protein
MPRDAEIGESWFEASPGKMVVRTYFKNELVVLVHICNPSYLGDRGRRIGLKPLWATLVGEPV